MTALKGGTGERLVILIQDVFIILLLCLLVVGFARGKLFPRQAIGEIVNQAILDAYKELG